MWALGQRSISGSCVTFDTQEPAMAMTLFGEGTKFWCAGLLFVSNVARAGLKFLILLPLLGKC